MTIDKHDDVSTQHWPLEIRLKQAEKALEVDFDDGAKFRYPAELLRVESPSAEVMGHGVGQKTIVSGRMHVGIMALEIIVVLVQAYVFALLSAVFIGMAIHAHH